MTSALAPILVVLVACAGPGRVDPAAPDPLLPDDGGAFRPSLLAVNGDDIAALADVATCATCHPEQHREWADSAHAHASFDNAWYRASVDAFRDTTSFGASRHCAGCHDPLVLLSGGMDAPVEATELAVAGVTCRVCHSAEAATADGNASLTVDAGPVPLPEEGDDASLARHRRAMAPELLGTPALCGACHRGWIGPETANPDFLVGMDELGAWGGSAWSGSTAQLLDTPVALTSCQGCHMRDRSHRAPGGHTALAAISPEQLDATRAMLREAAELYVVPIGDDAVDVVVRNVGAGHAFPAGLKDTQDVHLEVRVGGLGHDGVRLNAGLLGDDGHPERLHQVQRFRTLAWDGTIPAREARVVRYRLPPGTTGELEARLVHRRHLDPFHEAACTSSQSERGRTFPAEGHPDFCSPQPVTELAKASARVAEPSEDPDALFAHALALSRQLQERLDDARPSLVRGLALAADDPGRARFLALQARVEARQGRVDEAVRLVGEVRGLIGDHPALHLTLGRAKAQVWRWGEAAEHLAVVASQTPGDTAVWREYAQALGSAGRPADALDAARRGLALNPRDAALLRSQALALGDLSLSDERAREAWLAHRGPDHASELWLTCEREVEGCRVARQPVAEILLGEAP